MNEQNNLRPYPNLNAQILTILSEQPGLKAREIAATLNTDKKYINSALYGELKSKCSQDEKYCWYLKIDAPSVQRNNKETASKTALSNLCNYYLACL